ncbi:hypothetical protein A2U01_0084566, partial [Trifolium medium]|nr:hypothetical protein [Trifolium medium]
MLFPGDCGPGINKDKIVYSDFMDSLGGKLYTTIITGHVLCDMFMVLKGLKSSLDSI